MSVPEFVVLHPREVEVGTSKELREHWAEQLQEGPFQRHDYQTCTQACILMSLHQQRPPMPKRSLQLLDEVLELRKYHERLTAAPVPSAPKKASSLPWSAARTVDSDEEEQLVSPPAAFLPSICEVMSSSAAATHDFCILVEGGAVTPSCVYVCFGSQLQCADLYPSNYPSVALTPTVLGDVREERGGVSGTSTPERQSGNNAEALSPQSGNLLANTTVLTRYLGPASGVPLQPFISWLRSSTLQPMQPSRARDLTEQEALSKRHAKEEQREERQRAIAAEIKNPKVKSSNAPTTDQDSNENDTLQPAAECDKEEKSPPAVPVMADPMRLIFCGHGHGAAVAQLVVCRLIVQARAESADWIDRVGCLCFNPPALGCKRFSNSNLGVQLADRCLAFSSARDTLPHLLNVYDSSMHYMQQRRRASEQSEETDKTKTGDPNKDKLERADLSLTEVGRELRECIRLMSSIQYMKHSGEERKAWRQQIMALQQWQKSKEDRLLRLLSAIRLDLYGEHKVLLGDESFHTVGVTCSFLYSADGQHSWLPHHKQTQLRQCAYVGKTEIAALKYHAQMEHTAAVNPAQSGGPADGSDGCVHTRCCVSTCMAPANLRPVDSTSCLQWSTVNETSKARHNQIQVLLVGSNLGWVSHVTMTALSSTPRRIEPSIASNDHRLLFHFPTQQVLKTAKDRLRAEVFLHLHIATGGADDAGAVRHQLDLYGPMPDLLETYQHSAVVNMDIAGLLKQAFVYSLIAPAALGAKFDEHLSDTALNRFFAGRNDPTVVSKEVRGWVDAACLDAALMEKLSVPLSLSAVQSEVDRAAANVDFQAELRRREADMANVTDEEKKANAEKAKKMVGRFMSFKAAKEDYIRFQPKRKVLHEVNIPKKWTLSRYCEVVFQSTILAELSLARFKLTASSLLLRHLSNAIVVVGVAIAVAGVAAAGVFTFGAVPAAVGGGLAGLLTLTLGSGVSILTIMHEMQANYLDKLTLLCDVLGEDPGQLPACAFLLEKRLFDTLYARQHGARGEMAGMNRHQPPRCLPVGGRGAACSALP